MFLAQSYDDVAMGDLWPW